MLPIATCLLACAFLLPEALRNLVTAKAVPDRDWSVALTWHVQSYVGLLLTFGFASALFWIPTLRKRIARGLGGRAPVSR